MKGIITIYINRESGTCDEKSTIDLLNNYNADVFRKCKESGYPVMLVVTEKESCRAEKIDFSAPHPKN